MRIIINDGGVWKGQALFFGTTVYVLVILYETESANSSRIFEMNLRPLELWFVNVGHGDSTIIRFPSGRLAIVDINNGKALDERSVAELCEFLGVSPLSYRLACRVGGSEQYALKDYEALLEDPVDVLKRECPGEDVFRFIATHPDMDHLSGLYRLSVQEASIAILNFWDTANTKAMTAADFKDTRYDPRDWAEYKRLGSGDAGVKVLQNYRGAEGQYWTDDGVVILTPTRSIVEDANEREDWNHLSYVLKIVYGGTSVILPGDATTKSQNDLVDVFGDGLRATILKAPHHGRDSAYCDDFVRLVEPDYTIVSVGKKPDNDASNKYRKHSKKVYSTRFNGTIHAQLWPDGTVRMFNHAGERIDLDAEKERASRLFATLLRTGS